MGNSSGKQWVLLAAGSTGWDNYRHQANVCHAYQMAHRNGIPDQQIVVMMYDDIANNNQNPFPGNIINGPNGPNVYPGVPKDYTGADVTAKNFLAVLRGDPSAIMKQGPKKVIQSGKNDAIFVYLADHGDCGVFHFPNSTLYAHDLIDTIHTMAGNLKFSKMVIYMESCHSGSMFTELSDKNVYAVSACKPDEVSYAYFHDETRNTYLADIFSFLWICNTENAKLSLTSFGDQFLCLETKVPNALRPFGVTQTPCKYGDMSMLTVMLSELLGNNPHPTTSFSKTPDIKVSDVVDSTEVPLIIQKHRIRNEQDPEKKQALKRQYGDLIRKRKTVDEALQKIAERTNATRALSEKREMTRTYELKVVAEHFRRTLFNWHEEPHVVTRSHLQVLVNLCECGLNVKSITEAINYVEQEIDL